MGGQAGQPGQPGEPGQPGSAGGGAAVQGSGKTVTENRPVSGFDSVSFRGSAQLLIDQNGTEALSIEAEDNLMPLLIAEVSGRRLSLGVKDGASIAPTKPIVFRLSVRNLRRIEASGSGDMDARNLTGPNLEIDQSGSFQTKLQGTARREDIMLSGSGSFDAADLDCSEASVDISGSGDVTVKVASKLDAEISGSGTVKYSGDPLVRQTISGSGEVSKA